MNVFSSDDDREKYLSLLAEQAKRFGVHYLAWCLMSNHIHLVAVPDTKSSLARGIGEAHRRYTRYINDRQGWRGYLFQGRFHSCPLDGNHLLAAVRYVLRNPVRAGIADQPWRYAWSSAGWLVGLTESDRLAVHSCLLDDIKDWRSFLIVPEKSESDIRRHTQTGRPLGDECFLNRLEDLTGRMLRPRKRGPKPSN